jgi:hypothetical protein
VDDHDGQVEQFRRDAAKCAGIAGLFVEELIDEDVDEFTRRRLEPRIAVLTGLFWSACVLVVDELFEDLKNMHSPGFDPEETMALYGLPDGFRGQYNGRFLHQFIIATGVVTTRIATTWAYPATIGEALGTVLVLDPVGVLIDTYELDVDPHWRENLEGILFEDDDHELLYSDDDTIENAILSGGAVNLDFNSWFVPFRDPPETAPFAVAE